MRQKILEHLKALPTDIAALKNLCLRHFSADGVVEGVDEAGIVRIAHQPLVAPEAYGIILYPPASSDEMSNFEKSEYFFLIAAAFIITLISFKL